MLYGDAAVHDTPPFKMSVALPGCEPLSPKCSSMELLYYERCEEGRGRSDGKEANKRLYPESRRDKWLRRLHVPNYEQCNHHMRHASPAPWGLALHPYETCPRRPSG
eukprot:scaffold275429_cov35-Tisochrysis_lutea.AAC.2